MSKLKHLLFIFILLCLQTFPSEAKAPTSAEIAENLCSLQAFSTTEYDFPYTSTDHIAEVALNIRPSIVQIQNDEQYGEGSIISIDHDYIRILTAAHVLKNWDKNKEHMVIFFNGSVKDANLEYIDSKYDFGIVNVSTNAMDSLDLLRLKTVRINSDAFAEFDETAEKEIFAFDSVHSVDPKSNQKYSLFGANTGIAENYVYGPVIKTSVLVTDFGYPMLYAKCSAHNGMSGGGVFDTHGYFVGVLAGGSDQNEMVAVRLPDIISNLEAASSNEFSAK